MIITATLKPMLRRKQDRTVAVIATFVAVMMLSCRPGGAFQEFRHIEARGWARDSALVFTFETRVPLRGDVFFDLRNRGNYPFQNLWIALQTVFPDGHSKTDTLQLPLRNGAGGWTGTGIGDLFDNSILYRENMYFMPGQYRFIIRHRMPVSLLQGINDAGIHIRQN
ncbi:MAG: gliding motility lipoprotein GldH [Bacteroidales bacterium]|nr:gliding motility lipoprotein GldH [Bacteroidales bacterium]